MKYGSVCSGIEAATAAWHPLGWEPQWFSEVDPFPSAVLQHHYPHIPNHGDMTKYKEWNNDRTIELLVGGTPCQSYSVAGLRKGLSDPRGTSCLHILQWLNNLSPSGLSGKMSPVSCPPTEEGILVPSSGRWGKSGTGSPTECWTHNSSEFHKDAAVCSLSDILETGDVPQVFYLSPKACRGILLRAERRGKELPPQLQSALLLVAQETPE